MAQRTSLPLRYPGKARVDQALVYLRVAGRWAPWLDDYAKSGPWKQRHRYDQFREHYNEENF